MATYTWNVLPGFTFGFLHNVMVFFFGGGLRPMIGTVYFSFAISEILKTPISGTDVF